MHIKATAQISFGISLQGRRRPDVFSRCRGSCINLFTAFQVNMVYFVDEHEMVRCLTCFGLEGSNLNLHTESGNNPVEGSDGRNHFAPFYA